MQANQSITLYARTSGYVGKWLADIGDNVRKGQLLAVIETPDVDQQLEQARGTLGQAQANFEIARVTAQRWRELAEKKVVSPQDNDEKQSAYETAGAAIAAGQADVNRLEQLQALNQITAPYRRADHQPPCGRGGAGLGGAAARRGRRCTNWRRWIRC